MKLGLAIVVTIFLVTACSTTSNPTIVRIPTQVALPLPTTPILPKVDADELVCISDDAYEKLTTRDALLQSHINELRAIIKTTRPIE